MIVGVCRLTLLLPGSQSLKDKRAVLRSIKDRVNQKFNCAIAEVGDQDVWDSAQLGFAVVANERGFTQSVVQKILAFIEELALAKIVDDEQDFVTYGEESIEESNSWTHWEPDEPPPPGSRSTGAPAPGTGRGRIKLKVRGR
jgi:uncharacterized protein YlxP (DUF503 family)